MYIFKLQLPDRSVSMLANYVTLNELKELLYFKLQMYFAIWHTAFITFHASMEVFSCESQPK